MFRTIFDLLSKLICVCDDLLQLFHVFVLLNLLYLKSSMIKYCSAFIMNVKKG